MEDLLGSIGRFAFAREGGTAVGRQVFGNGTRFVWYARGVRGRVGLEEVGRGELSSMSVRAAISYL
jgi:hypothetical protein